MNTALWVLVVAVAIPYLLAGASAYFKTKQFGAMDNKDPRGQSTRLTGAGARAVAAQANAWEALALYTVAIVVTHFAGVPAADLATAALVFLAARILHVAFYLADMDKLRSAAFIVAAGSCIYMIVQAA